MAHLTHETLWALARRELNAEATADAQAHLHSCDACQVQLAQVTEALGVLALMPEAPELPSLIGQRVGARLQDHFDARDAKSFSGWWRFSFSPWWVVAAVLALAVGVAVVTRQAPPEVNPVATHDDAEKPGAPQVVAAAQPVQATIVSARKASRKAGTLAPKQTVAAGETLTTDSGGQLWFKLPDGSKAGLTSASQVHLKQLEAKTVALEVAQGNLALVIPHRQDRLLTVTAGDVQVKDLGTRFLVSRDVGRVLVAVEEGSVEVAVPGQTRTLSAGHALTWGNGALKEVDWGVTPVRVAPTAAVQPTTEALKPPEPTVATANPEDEWAPLPPQNQPAVAVTPVPSNAMQPLPPQVPVAPPGAPTPPDEVNSFTESRLMNSLQALEQRVRSFGAGLSLPRLNGETEREWQARVIAQLGDAHDCVDVLTAASKWLHEPPEAGALEVKLRRSVLTQQMRCLQVMGRANEARAVEDELRQLQ